MGGVDVTDKFAAEIGHDVSDALLCEITNLDKYKQSKQLHHLNSNNTKNESNCKTSTSIEVCSNAFDTYAYGYPTKIEGEHKVSNNSNLYIAEAKFNIEARDIYGGRYGCNGGTCCYKTSSQVAKLSSTTYHNKVECQSFSDEPTSVYYKPGKVVVSTYANNRAETGIEDVDQANFKVDYPDISSDIEYPEKNMGDPEIVPSCNIPSSFIGNPINLSVGNKFQREVDIQGIGTYPLSFIRTYNSLDATWRNNYSTEVHVVTYPNHAPIIKFIHSDGREIRFYESNGLITAGSSELGKLKKISSGYEYTSPFHEIYDFDSSGRLVKSVNNGGLVHNIKHISDTELIVSDNSGHSLTITETKDHQPLSVKSSDGKVISYQYDSQNRLIKVTKNSKTRTYHYEDINFPGGLTGITDENGIRYVTWTYDAKRRANSSTYFDGKDKITITYNSGTQTTFTNPLGRKYTYNYTVIDNVKRITSIKGDASSQCPAINTSYEYNSRGLVTLKTDGKGIKTSYTYNDAGQETSSTIGVGTPEALTIKTTWDSRFFNKPQTVTYPDKIIKYSYDAKGNATNQTIQSLK